MKTVCVIPARHGSSRLPAKPLILLHGRPMIQWVVAVAKRIPVFDEVLVATDHEDIAAAARAAGVDAVMTDPALPSGSDRAWAAVKGRAADIIVNLQGDEPAMPAEALLEAHAALVGSDRFDVATACVPLYDRDAFEAPHIVKVVRAADRTALYFSRSPIPSLARREAPVPGSGIPIGHKHLGIYLFKRASLERFVSLPPSPLERMECLEQLRMLEAGMRLVCVESTRDSVGVDVAEDIAKAEAVLRGESG